MTASGGHAQRRHRARRYRKSVNRSLLLESLEDRRLLASDFKNSFNEYDVNDDGIVAPLDALLIINSLNASGTRSLVGGSHAGDQYVDVNGDNMIAPIDALLVIIALNAGKLGDLVTLTEHSHFLQENFYDLVLPPISSGSRKISFDVNTRLNTSDQSAALEDQLLVYLVDPSQPQTTILDRGTPGTALFSLSGSQADFLPGLVRFDGHTVEIDASAANLTGPVRLKFQLLNSDTDVGSRVAMRSFEVLTNATGVPSVSFPQTTQIVAAASSIDLAPLVPASDLVVAITNAHFDTLTDRYIAELTVSNSGAAVGRTVVVRFPNLPTDVSLLNASGVDASGVPYINFQKAITAGGLQRSGQSSAIRLEFANPNDRPIALHPEILTGPANSAPVFTALGAQSVIPGAVLEIPLTASDADGDSISYWLLPGNTALPNMALRADGTLVVRPIKGQEGSYTIDVVASDGVATTTKTIALNVLADPITATRVSGIVQLTDGTPLANVRVEIGAVQGLTAADGSFTLNLGAGPIVGDTLKIRGELFSGPFALPFIAEKLPLVLEHEVYLGSNNVISRPIFLPALDLNNGKVIDPQLDIVVTSEKLPGVSVAVEAGTLFDQQGIPFTGVLSITEVPIELTPISLPEHLVPDIVVTVQPGEMNFAAPAPMTFPNRSGWTPGTLMDLWSINPTTGQFDDVGDMIVSADGLRIETISGGVRNSSWHFPAPPPEESQNPSQNQKNTKKKCDSCKSNSNFNSMVDDQTGVVTETHDLVTYESLGETRGLTLTYNSLWADPREIVHFGYNNTIASANRLLVASMNLSRGTFSQQVPGYELRKPQPTDFQDSNFFLSASLSSVTFQGTAGQTLFIDSPRTSSRSVGIDADGDGDIDHYSTYYDIQFISVEASNGDEIYHESVSTNDRSGPGAFTLPATGTYTISTSGLLDDGRVSFHLRDVSDLNLRGGEHFWEVSGGDIDPALLVDLSQLPSGVYNYHLTTGLRLLTASALTGSSTTSQGELVHVNRIGSVFGNGWGLAGHQEIVENPDGSLLLIDGGGTQLVFGARPNAASPYVSPPGDFTKLEKLADGTFQRTTTGQTVYKFNAQRQLASVRNRLGNETKYQYDGSGHLTSIVDPVGLQTTLTYTSGRVTSITDPANRVTQLQYDSVGNLQSITNPDQSRRTWEYDARRHMVSEVDELSRREQAFYDFAGRASRAILKDGSEIRIQPTQVQGLLPFDATIDPRNAVRAPRLTPPTASYADANGNVRTAVLDQAGQVISSTDGVANTPVVVRNDANLVSQVTNGRGQVTTYEYDARGNLISVSDPLAFGQQGPGTGDTINLNAPLFTAVGDLNDDGASDLVTVITTAQGETAVGVQLRNPDGTFPTPVVVLRGLGTVQVSLGDVDGDGDMDLITANSRGNDSSVGVQLAGGDGTFSSIVEYAVEAGILATKLLDINGDDWLDIVTVNSNSKSISVLVNLEEGQFNGRIRRTGLNPIAFVTGDFNADGRPDAVVTNSIGHSLSIFLGSERDLIAPASTTLELGQQVPVETAIGDLDGDGDMDLAVATQAEYGSFGAVSIFLGNGDGTFQQTFPLSLNADVPRALAIGDLDRDGNRDVMVATNNGVRLLRNTGLASFEEVENLNQTSARHLALGDLDGDGDLDVVTGAEYSGQTSSWLNSGTGELTFQALLDNGLDDGVMELADYNADGYLDLVIGAFGAFNNIRIYAGDGTGEFIQTSVLSTYPLSLGALTLGDVDGDGDLDIAAARANGYVQPGDELRIFINEGEDQFAAQPPQLLTAPLDRLGLVDLDADGRLDIVGISGSRNRLAIHPGLGNGIFQNFDQAEHYEVGIRPVALAAGDFDDDGDLDLVMAGSEATAVLLFNAGAGNFTSGPNLALSYDAQAGDLVVADINRDGKLDIALSRASLQRVTIYTGQGDGTFAERRDYATRGSADMLATLDVDHDSDLDLIVVSKSLGSTLILENADDGTFPDPVIQTNVNSGKSLSADLDGDDQLDLIVAGSGGIALLRGKSGGLFHPAEMVTESFHARDFALGDLDEDGDLDIVASSSYYSGGHIIAFFNHNGQFEQQVTLAETLPETTAIGLGDVTGDGHLDLIYGQRLAGTISVFVGDGEGHFHSAGEYAAIEGLVHLTLRDLSGDGLLDVVTTTGANQAIRILENQGNGVFPRPVLRLPDYATAQAVGDLNKDTFQDVVILSGSGELVVALGLGNGGFVQQPPLAVNNQQTEDVALGDFNGDGNLDIVVAGYSSNGNGILTYLGDGQGGFAEPSAAGIEGINYSDFSVGSLQVGDFDGDLDLDLLVGRWQGSVLLKNDGVANWTLQSGGLFAQYNERFLTGDTDGDGDLDIVLRSGILLNSGSGAYDTLVPINLLAMHSVTAFALADVDGDADLDLIAQQPDHLGQTRINVLQNQGGNTFVLAESYDLEVGASNAELVVGDVDGDGKLDIAAKFYTFNSYYYQHNLVTLKGLGNGAFVVNRAQATPGGLHDLALAHIDGDNRLDLVALGERGQLVLLAGDETSSFRKGELATHNQAEEVIIGDIDDDGDLDLIVRGGEQYYTPYQQTANRISVLINQGNGQFSSPQLITLSSAQSSLVLADLNGDSHLDIAATLGESNRVAVALGNGDGTFAAPREFATREAPSSLAARDEDQDGDLDLIVVIGFQESIQVLLNTGEGEFPEPQITTAPYPRSLDSGDYNSDGLLDLVLAHQGGVSILKGAVGGTFSSAEFLAVGLNYISDAKWADVDRDGDLDLILVGNQQSNAGKLVVLKNTANQLVESGNFDIGDSSDTFVLGDIDGDGDLDAVMRGYVSNYSSVSVLLGDGNGAFFGLAEYASGLGWGKLALEDVDGDDELDIVTTNSWDSTISVIKNLGGGVFEGHIYRTGPVPRDDAYGDLNGDGKPDLVTANSSSGSFSILLAMADATFAQPLAVSIDEATAVEVELGDLNDDGKLDLVVAMYIGTQQADYRLEVYLGQGDGTFGAPVIYASQTDAISAVQLGDMEGDGDLDIFYRSGTSVLTLLRNDGEASFSAGEALYFNATSFALADLNGDNDLDVVVANANAVNVLQNNAGVLSVSSSQSGSFLPIQKLHLADLDADGDQDVLVARSNTNFSGNSRVEIYRNQGDGELAPPTTLSVAGVLLDAMITGDFDANGDLDLAIATRQSPYQGMYYQSRGKLHIYLGDGSSGFVLPVVRDLIIPATSLHVASLGGDSLPDLIGVSFPGSRIVSLINQGQATFTEAHSPGELVATVTQPYDVATGDVDGDGIADLLVAGGNYLSRSLVLHKGLAGGGFAVPQQIPTSSYAEAIKLVDINRDGHLDVVATAPDVSRVMVLLNDGHGEFANRREYVTGLYANLLSVSDVDRDGDLDLVIGNTGLSNVEVLMNHGDGTFPGLELHTGKTPRSLTLADINNDGLTDLVTANFGGNNLSFLLGLPDGGFAIADDSVTAGGQQPPGRGLRSYTYDSVFNQLTSVTDELGRQTLFLLDPANGNMLSSIQVVGLLDSESDESDDVATHFTYTSYGQIDTILDPLGRLTDYDYDALGRVITVVTAKGTSDAGTRRYEYDAAGNVIATIDENNHRTSYVVDAMNRVTTITEADPDGAGPLASPVTSFAYDLAGNLTQSTDAANHVTTNQYDERDRLVRTVDAQNQVRTFTYDRIGNLLTAVDPLGNVTRNKYDARNRLVGTIDAEGGRTRFAYDADDNLTFVADPVGNVTSFQYDQRDRLVQENDPRGQATRYVYDAANQLVGETDRNGRRTNYAYDDLGRLTTERWVSATGATDNLIEYQYDRVGNLLKVNDKFSSLAFTYDTRDRVKTVDNAGSPGAPQVLLTYTYDAVGNVLSVTDVINGQAGGVNTYAYDALNRTARITQTGVGISDKRVDLTYNVLGQYQSIDRYRDLAGTQLVVRSGYTYDTLNRLTSLTHQNTTGTVAFYDYVYDVAGRITRITSVDGVADYSYDYTSQLIGADYSSSNIPDETYDYDANGNRVYSHLHNQNYRTGAANRLLTDGVYNYAYDNEGNLIRRTEIATGNVREFTWDHRNRLTAVTDKTSAGVPTQRVTFTYDSADRRITKSVDTTPTDAVDAAIMHFVYDREDVLLDFIDSDGTGPAATGLAERYLHGAGIDEVFAQDSGAESMWYLHNHLGSTGDVVNSGGGNVVHFNYDSFGNMLSASVDKLRYTFTGREFDTEIGFSFYRARYYNPEIGVFSSEDPLGLSAGDGNLRRYVSNSPLLFTDPSGRTWSASVGGSVLGSGIQPFLNIFAGLGISIGINGCGQLFVQGQLSGMLGPGIFYGAGVQGSFGASGPLKPGWSSDVTAHGEVNVGIPGLPAIGGAVDVNGGGAQVGFPIPGTGKIGVGGGAMAGAGVAGSLTYSSDVGFLDWLPGIDSKSEECSC